MPELNTISVIMYAKGEGVPEDDAKAYAWLSIVAAQGDESAKKNKDIVYRTYDTCSDCRGVLQRHRNYRVNTGKHTALTRKTNKQTTRGPTSRYRNTS